MSTLRTKPFQTARIVPLHPALDAQTIEHSFEACREITRTNARNFFYGLRLTPEPRRSAVFSLYAWMRRGDDLVDTAADIDSKLERLSAFEARTRSALAGVIPTHPGEPFWPAFASTVESYPVDRACLSAMLDGLREDLSHSGYATWEDLDGYCYKVGSTVGVTCMNIWGLRNGADPSLAKAKSISRGRAFQLTNILRDIAADFDDIPSRVYLPRSLLAAHGLTAAELRGWQSPVACTNLVHQAAARARAFYDESRGLEELIDPDCAPALWGMTRIYRGILEVVESDPSRVVARERVRLSAARKGLIALSAVVRRRAGAWEA